jgi:tubulin polyglutamylase TTLL6/13
VDSSDRVVAQHYLDSPYLIKGLKFDLRIYVLLYGINPLKVYLFEDGLARFATSPYRKPKRSNMKNMFMHLTNYSINKTSADFVHNQKEDGTGDGHKKSLNQIYEEIASIEGADKVKELKDNIKDVLIKTLITGEPSIKHIYKSC